MQESAIKVLESKVSDAEVRESRISRIAVEGYDTSLRRVDVDDALREHFASCGNIIHVYVPIDAESGILCRYALVYVSEEDEEKALRLDGSDMGGRILRINPYPFHANHLDEVFFSPMKEEKLYLPQLTIMVTGYDTSLPIDVIETQLEEYFSAVGSFVVQNVTTGVIRSPARVHVRGQEGVEKALERSGRSVGGLNFVVTRAVPLPKNPIKTGYIHPTNFTLLTKEQIEDPNLYFVYDVDENKNTETMDGNQKKKKKSKTREGNQKKQQKKKKRKNKAREGNQKKKSETRDGNQKMKGVQISF